MSATALTSWCAGQAGRPRVRGPRRRVPAVGGMRFAFYGRTSTDRFQDPVSSRQWQRDSAVRAIADRGRIVAEFVDVGFSRSVSWHDRPQASALLRAAADPDRGFDAVVIGEFERAFDKGQARAIIAQFNAYGVAVWLPEFDGPVDLSDADHRALFALLGHQSEREVLRARRRTTVAMRAQVRIQGRHLGGRPPYGYRLVDAGPHPNKEHARWGRRLQRLGLDPVTAPQVQWMFAQRLTGTSRGRLADHVRSSGAATSDSWAGGLHLQSPIREARLLCFQGMRLRLRPCWRSMRQETGWGPSVYAYLAATLATAVSLRSRHGVRVLPGAVVLLAAGRSFIDSNIFSPEGC